MKRLVIVVIMVGLVLTIFGVPSAQAQGGSGYAPDDLARVRVVHASPDAPPVTILVNNRPVFKYLRFGEISFYAPLAAGRYNVKVVTADANQAEVINTDVDLANDTDYTVLAVGLAANIEPLVLIDDNTLPEPGKAKVRLVHASPDAPAVDVAIKSGDVLFNNIAFKTATDYLTVDANVYNLEVRPASATDVVLNLPGVSLRSGSVSTVFALGLLNGQPSLRAELRLDNRSKPGSGYYPGYCCQRPPVYHRPHCCQNSYYPPRSYYRPNYRPYYYGHPNYNYGSYSYKHGWYYNHYPKYW